MDGYRVDCCRAAIVPIEDEPGVDLALAGFLAGEVGIVHALQSLRQDVNAPQMAPLVHALEPIGGMQERRL